MPTDVVSVSALDKAANFAALTDSVAETDEAFDADDPIELTEDRRVSSAAFDEVVLLEPTQTKMSSILSISFFLSLWKKLLF